MSKTLVTEAKLKSAVHRIAPPSSGGGSREDRPPPSSGRPLDAQTRASMEARFGWDFGRVRIHTDSRSADLAQSVNARAYTVGEDVVFARGQYAPNSAEGDRLLAHELTHVLQQTPFPPPLAPAGDGRRAERTAVRPDRSGRLRRTLFNVGSVQVEVNYGNVELVPETDYTPTIGAQYVAWTARPASEIHAGLAALTGRQKRWVMYGLDLLRHNSRPEHSRLNRVDAVHRLMAFAPSSSTYPTNAGLDFEREILWISGWLEVALAAPLTAPTGASLATITSLYNPAAGPFNAARLHSDLPPLLLDYLRAMDPNRFTSAVTHDLPTLRTIGDLIQDEARTFFSPYADTAIHNRYSGGLRYSANIIDVATATHQLSPEDLASRRMSYLRNRGEMVGRMTNADLTRMFREVQYTPTAALPATSLLGEINFDSSNGAHRSELEATVRSLLRTVTVPNLVDRILRRTGIMAATGGVGIPLEYRSVDPVDECYARWRVIETLCHELLHLLVHPDFPSRADSIQFGQIVDEAFTEVLSEQLYEYLQARAAIDLAFKDRMEAGLPASCPSPRASTLGYGQAGHSAQQIRNEVGDDNFRAAYFLGAVHLVGLGTSPTV